LQVHIQCLPGSVVCPPEDAEVNVTGAAAKNRCGTLSVCGLNPAFLLNGAPLEPVPGQAALGLAMIVARITPDVPPTLTLLGPANLTIPQGTPYQVSALRCSGREQERLRTRHENAISRPKFA
jgi:hypothetical protein